MSFLGGVVAAKEGAYFLRESKQAVGRLADKQKSNLPPTSPSSSSGPQIEIQADVLPEVLRHNPPPGLFSRSSAASDSSSSSSSSTLVSSKWALRSDPKTRSSPSPDAINPLKAYVSMPPVTFGPKRWQLPHAQSSVLASTANELRSDRYAPVSPQKLKAAAVGFKQIGMAFAIATVIVFGGATLMIGLTAFKLELHSIDDIRTKGQDLVQPKIQSLREQLTPLRTWAEDRSKKWNMQREEDIRDNPLIKELSKTLASKTSN